MTIQNVEVQEDDTIKNGLMPLLVQGLTSKPCFLPSLFLWDQRGLQLFEEITHSEYYYLFKAETEVLSQNTGNVLNVIEENSVILELGSGSLEKSGIILGSLAQIQRPVDYYALDVSQSELDRTLQSLKKRLNNDRNVKCHSLTCTYEQSIPWLLNNPELHGRTVTVLWLGSSIANETPQEIRRLMTAFASAKTHSKISKLQFLIGVDGCKDPSRISRAYDIPGGQSRQFTLNGLENANRVLGQEIFNINDWAFRGIWDEMEAKYETCISPTKDLLLEINDLSIELKKGELVRIVTSRKLGRNEFNEILQYTGLSIAETWEHSDLDYSLHRICMV